MRHLLGLALLLVATAMPADAQPAPPAADAIFAGMTAQTPGLVVLVAQNGKIIYQRAAGAADIEQQTQLTLATRFHMASVSKQFTAAAVLLLAREGKLRMDAPARTYLPELPEAYAAVTVAQLLNHTSGLRDTHDLVRASGASMADFIRQDRMYALIRSQRSLNFTPGAEYRYTNSGYLLAAEIVARVSGMPFPKFLEDHLFRPLGMNDSLVYTDAGVPIVGRAQSYSVGSAGEPRNSRLTYSYYGATSVISTAPDLYRWSRELLHPKLLDPSIIAEMEQPTRLTDGTVSNYGLGLFSNQVRGHSAMLHTGTDAGFRTLIAVYPREDATIIILSNGSADVGILNERLVDAFLTEHPGPDEIAVPARHRLTALEGYYVASWGPGFELSLDGGKLVRRIGGGPPQPATFHADGTFRFASPAVRFEVVSNDVLREAGAVGPPLDYRRTTRSAPAANDLQSMSGQYRSDELDYTVSLTFTAGHLEMSSMLDPAAVKPVPADQDWFDLASGRIHVERDASGRVIAVLLTTSRVRGIRFSRVR